MALNKNSLKTARIVNHISSQVPLIPTTITPGDWVSARINQLSIGFNNSKFFIKDVEVLADPSIEAAIKNFNFSDKFNFPIKVTALNPNDTSAPYRGEPSSFILNISTNDPLLDILLRPILGYIYQENVSSEAIATRFTLQQIDGLDAETAKELSNLLFKNNEVS